MAKSSIFAGELCADENDNKYNSIKPNKTMKKLTLSFMMLCLALTTMAEPIGKQSALYSAQSFMLAKGKQVAATQTSSRSKAAGQDAQSYYYVFNAENNGGYVIVSGDDRVEPILGYVDHGSFDPDNIPENMRSWLQLYADQIKYIVDNDIQPGDPRIRKRNKVQGVKHSVGEMLTTRWNQGRPYNLTCPDYYLEKDQDETTTLPKKSGPATGCTATAMAQLMYFYRYPEKVKKDIPAYSITYTSQKDNSVKKTVTVPRIARNTIIDWDNMRDTYSWQDEAHANAQDTAVANLMRFCGQAVTMHYGPSSGANFSAEAYINYFGYATGAYVGERRDYSIDDWFDIIYNEIEQGYPVLFSGFSSGGGHAFVLDGFDGDNLFHLNWGWGGGSNGWFLVSILNPGDNSGIGASSSSDGYSMSQRALFNLRLPGTPKSDAYLTISDVSIDNDKESIKAKFTNRTGVSNTFNTGIVMLEEDGSLTQVGNKQTISGMGNGASTTKTFQLTGHLTEGTYKLSPASKPSRSDIWQSEYDFKTQYIEAVVDNTGAINLQFLNPIPTTESISIDTITFPGTRIAGKQQEVKVTFRNNGKEYFKTIYMHTSKTASSPSSDTYADSKSQVAVRAGETVDVSYFFKPKETGTYKLWFCTSSDGSGKVGQGTMEVITEAQAVLANLTVESYTVTNGSTGIAYGNCLVGKAGIRNNKNEDFHGPVRLTIWRQPGGNGSAWGGSSQTYDVNIMAGEIAYVNFDFDNLNEGDKYYLQASYVNQDGSLGNGGVWDLGGWMIKTGIATWKSDGLIVGKEYKASISTASNVCGVYANCSKKITRMTPNANHNTIYAFGADMAIPNGISNHNVVSGKHADQINLTSGSPYYLPATFRADVATFTYNFSETEDGTKWQAFTMPFEADSIFLDDVEVSLDDTLNHFWIYEFANQSMSGKVVFAPATRLRSGTPYIIAADAKMAGRSLVFRAHNVPFYKTGTDKMVVTSSNFKFNGNTFAPKRKNCYILNEEGTAFDYTDKLTELGAMAPYFTTDLSEEEMPASIQLPEIPVAPVRNLELDETVPVVLASGLYDQITLKRTFETGFNTICLPFEVDDIEAVFGEGATVYEYCSYANNELDFLKTETLEAGKPYIIILPETHAENIVVTDVCIDPANLQAASIGHQGAFFLGTYSPVLEGEGTIYGLTAEGTLVKLEDQPTPTGLPTDEGASILIKGFSAYFTLPDGTETATILLYDDPTGISKNPKNFDYSKSWFDLNGRKLSGMPIQRGIYIMNGKKVLK